MEQPTMPPPMITTSAELGGVRVIQIPPLAG